MNRKPGWASTLGPRNRRGAATSANQGDPSGCAAFRRGAKLVRREDHAGAKAAYQEAINGGDPEYGPRSSLALAELLQRNGELGAARDCYQAAIDSGHVEVAPAAALALGLMLADIPDNQQAIDDALVAFQRAAESDHPQHAPYAALMLTLLCGVRHDFVGARTAARRAVTAGPSQTSMETFFGYARMLADQFGDFEGATTFLHEIIDSADPIYTAKARAELDMLEAAAGDLDAYRSAVDAT